MTPEEQTELLALNEAISAAEASPWLPRCVVAAFTPLCGETGSPQPRQRRVGALVLGPLTFGNWLALEAARSPFLVDDWHGMRDVSRLAEALAVLSGVAIDARWVVDRLAPAEAVAAVKIVREIVSEGLSSTALAMRRPGGKPESASPRDPMHGFGLWTLLLTLTCRMLRRTPAEVMPMPAAQAFVLAAAADCLDGLEPKGASYAEREALTALGSGEEGLLFGSVEKVQDDRQGKEERVAQQEGRHEEQAKRAVRPEDGAHETGNDEQDAHGSKSKGRRSESQRSEGL